jgi:hypothetical protein
MIEGKMNSKAVDNGFGVAYHFGGSFRKAERLRQAPGPLSLTKKS